MEFRKRNDCSYDLFCFFLAFLVLGINICHISSLGFFSHEESVNFGNSGVGPVGRSVMGGGGEGGGLVPKKYRISI